MKKDRRENLTVHDTKAPFNGRFDLAWLSTDLFPPSGLEIVYECDRESSTQEQNKTSPQEFVNRVVCVSISGPQFRFRALCDTFGVLRGYGTLRDRTSC